MGRAILPCLWWLSTGGAYSGDGALGGELDPSLPAILGGRVFSLVSEYSEWMLCFGDGGVAVSCSLLWGEVGLETDSPPL